MNEPHPRPEPQSQQVEAVFHACFGLGYRTRLVGGALEPQYLPAGPADDWHRVIYREDFVASALHEIAHWCIAGTNRRTLPDYGYWYEPDGRSAGQQLEFEQVEVMPQAIEWHFSLAAGVGFRVSEDNLGGERANRSTGFARSICARARQYAEQRQPPRALLFRDALAARFDATIGIQSPDFGLSRLVSGG